MSSKIFPYLITTSLSTSPPIINFTPPVPPTVIVLSFMLSKALPAIPPPAVPAAPETPAFPST